jgi:hypothetical protein
MSLLSDISVRKFYGEVKAFGIPILQLSLAEVLFAQGRLQEAGEVCSDVQSKPNLLKFERLRLQITLAKIHHIQSDNEGALSHWCEALKEIRRFQFTNGRTTRLIIMSICDNLTSLGQVELLQASEQQITYLEEIAKPGGIQWWIAGMRQWLDHLQSSGRRSRI